MAQDSTAEEKIKEAAKSLFTKNGFAATKTRDIAEKAGINLALLNYYYRSKELLFNKIMMEVMSMFMKSIFSIFQDERTTLEQKFELIASRYIDKIKSNPDIPNFLLNELRSRPEEFFLKIIEGKRLQDFYIYTQLVEQIGEERVKGLNPIHIMMNLMSLTLFPFVGKPMMRMVTGIDNAVFNKMMEERKKLIPMWIMQMLK
ncbi:TetR/AcrR family transcriptional regulator [Reichenbachiella ulvae]|uniref:TetR/AcrR family transcriptional regulator n=1 Tax=Reichenbachiella ulvae TaxID=2980104 RepID=A0ABT3CRF3_9BACT|nr:TetR/AcrR family transcriptional regulator [Reichenbachiella ulvae]MCV9386070.1 TetR/AcrR family transcriptional regulator [Reichenbachiella ulvae]